LGRSAKTGIQYPPELTEWGKAAEATGYWIPACAGMTRRVGGVRCWLIGAHEDTAFAQRWSDCRVFSKSVCHPGLVRSAKTGIQYPPELMGWGKAAEAAGYWIPACAGMTRRVGGVRCWLIGVDEDTAFPQRWSDCRVFSKSVCHPGLVRSAKTGIQYPPELTEWGKAAEAVGCWIPACAGMTWRVGGREVLADWSA
jgi:hypothetical protein